MNDVLSSTWGFTASNLGFDITQGDMSSSLLTNADILCWTNPETVAYEYDTNMACVNDENACNDIQLIEQEESNPLKSADDDGGNDGEEGPPDVDSSSGASPKFQLGALLVLSLISVQGQQD